jgi:hypothetical protein
MITTGEDAARFLQSRIFGKLHELNGNRASLQKARFSADKGRR